MKKYKFVVLFFVITIIYSIFPLHANALSPPDVTAHAAMLVETSTGEVFFAKNEHARMYPASTTKIMTVLLAVEAYERGEVKLDDMIEASSSSHYDLSWDGSSQNILPGEVMSFEDLLYCALVSSANEACNILGEYLAGGDIYEFYRMMNKRASELGCTDTNFANTHGLPNDNHYTTAYDLYLLAAEAVTHPLFMRLCNTVSREVPATNMSDKRYISSTNSMLKPDSQYYYKYAVGIKTGFTDAAGFCLVSSAEKDGTQLIGVVLGSEARPAEDGAYDMCNFIDSRTMYEWFFNNFSLTPVLSESELITQVKVGLGEGADSVLVRPDSTLKLIVPNDIDLETEISRNVVIHSELEGAKELTAPIEKGQVLGEITLNYKGTEYGPIPLIANTNVELSRVELMKQNVRKTFSNVWVKVVIAIIILIFASYIALVVRYNIIRSKKRKQKMLRRQQASQNNRDR